MAKKKPIPREKLAALIEYANGEHVFPEPIEAGERWQRCHTWPWVWASTAARIASTGTEHANTRPLALIKARSTAAYNVIAAGPINRARHAFVADAFLGPRPKGNQVRHMDGNAQNNRPSNLLYGTRRDNALDKHRHGTMSNVKLTEAQVREILAVPGKHGVYRHLARKFGVHDSCIASIRKGTSWSHVAPEIPRPIPDGRPSAEAIAVIRKTPTYRGCLSDLARRFNVSKVMCSSIRGGDSYPSPQSALRKAHKRHQLTMFDFFDWRD